VLEVIDKGSSSEAHPVPLLFVHGAWHAAWCWDEYFLGFFAERGYRALAMNLRDHGNGAGTKPPASVADYVTDVESVVAQLPTPPVLIGHSLGGFVTQKYLESHDAPAAVLVASLPPRGGIGTLARCFRRRPWFSLKSIVTGKTMPGIATVEIAYDFYSASTPSDHVALYAARVEEQPPRKVLLDIVVSDLPQPERVGAPVLVLGGADDLMVSCDEVADTARAYRTGAHIFSGMGHNLMLEPGWAQVAGRIESWLTTQGL
jgi:pimeloyl-ACP methyl ester carboxylesterase